MQYNSFLTFPQTGWPQVLDRFLKEGIKVLNFAKNGRSTKSFIDEGLFNNALEKMNSSTLVLIQFGHNDQKQTDPTRYTEAFGSYQSNLIFMIGECLKRNAKVILLTPITERKFVDGQLILCHGDYPKAMMNVAKEMNIPCIDLYERTRESIISIGEQESKRLYMVFSSGVYKKFPNGLEDNTHLRYDGAFMVASCFYEEMIKNNLYTCLFKEMGE